MLAAGAAVGVLSALLSVLAVGCWFALYEVRSMLLVVAAGVTQIHIPCRAQRGSTL